MRSRGAGPPLFAACPVARSPARCRLPQGGERAELLEFTALEFDIGTAEDRSLRQEVQQLGQAGQQAAAELVDVQGRLAEAEAALQQRGAEVRLGAGPGATLLQRQGLPQAGMDLGGGTSKRATGVALAEQSWLQCWGLALALRPCPASSRGCASCADACLACPQVERLQQQLAEAQSAVEAAGAQVAEWRAHAEQYDRDRQQAAANVRKAEREVDLIAQENSVMFRQVCRGSLRGVKEGVCVCVSPPCQQASSKLKCCARSMCGAAVKRWLPAPPLSPPVQVNFVRTRLQSHLPQLEAAVPDIAKLARELQQWCVGRGLPRHRVWRGTSRALPGPKRSVVLHLKVIRLAAACCPAGATRKQRSACGAGA